MKGSEAEVGMHIIKVAGNDRNGIPIGSKAVITSLASGLGRLIIFFGNCSWSTFARNWEPCADRTRREIRRVMIARERFGRKLRALT